MSKRKIEPVKSSPLQILPSSYPQLLNDLKKRIQIGQIKANLSVNRELIKLYWDIGKTIVEKQREEDWGTKVIERLGQDLQKEFPGVGGFSRTNIFRMRAFYIANELVPQAVGQLEEFPVFRIPWGHNVVLLDKIKDPNTRLWYAQQSIENGWSRNTLEMWIESDLYKRKGKALTNFKETLPKTQSDLVEQSLRDPYCFDFLTISEEAREKDIENGLVAHVQKFLTELGAGFAFVGRQYPIEVENETFYIDLLFYHFKLRRFIIIELKNGPFQPEHAGKMAFYLGAVDASLKHRDDEASIGLILCRTKKKLIAEYALQDMKRPIGVASFKVKLIEYLPEELKTSLPTIEEIQAELGIEAIRVIPKKKRGSK